MPLHLLLAPAASGKTLYCIKRIQTLRRDAERLLEPIWVIVPNGANVTAFRHRLGEAGGAMGVHVSTFYTLYAELLAQAEQLVARLDEPILYRLLRDVAAELHSAGALNFFANIHTTPGYARALHASIQELKRARIMPEEFATQVQGRHARLEELARLYDAYQRRLLASDWADAEGQGWLAALALEHDANLARGWQLLVVDGFDEFNPTQLAVLRLLSARADETLITLTGDVSPERSRRIAHHRFVRARAAIEEKLSPLLVLSHSPTLPLTPLRNIESLLFEPSSRNISADDAIQLIEAPNRAEEIRAAMRWLKARIVRDEMKPSQIALLARNIEPYRAFIEETAAEFGMPIFLRAGANLATNPAIAALLNLLALVAQDFPRRRVSDAWRNPYIDWSAQGIQANDAEQLDAAARWGQVVAGVSQWQDTLTRLANVSADDESAERDDPRSDAPTGVIAAALWQKFQAFVARITPPERATMRGYVAWLEALIGDDPGLLTEYQHESDTSLRLVRCARKILTTSERDVAALQELKNVLRALVFTESILGGAREIAFSDFWNDLRGAVEASAYQVLPPKETESILVTSILSARGLSFCAVALVGLAEGEFPRAAIEDPLLPETDRAALNLSPRWSGDEVTFFYEAVTRATEKLLLTRPYLADDGQPWEESPYWKHIRELIDVEPARSDTPLSQAEAASLAELSALLKSSDAITHGAQILSARMADDARGMFEGDLSAMQARLARDYSTTRPWSASRLETFGTCPFAFFAAYGLHLEPRAPTEAGFDVRQLGTMYHAILETLYRNAPDPTDVDALLAALPDIACKIFDDAPTLYGFRPTELWQQQRAELERILAETVRALHEASVGWKPARFEMKFDSLVLRDGANEIRLRGYIDRVDTNDAGELRVLDYKAGSSAISKQDLDDGKRLQLALYAFALRNEIKLGNPTHGLYWHIGAAKPSNLKLEKYPGGAKAAFETATTHALSHVLRVRAGDFAPHVPSGGCPNWCPATAFCWRYKPK